MHIISKITNPNFRGCDFMKAKDAWKNFKKTGEIEDYLEYCKLKRLEEQEFGKKPENKWNNHR